MSLKRLLLLTIFLIAAIWSNAFNATMIVQIDGDSLTNWTASTGNDWDCINEYPYNDADYVYTTGTANGIFQCADSTLPIGAIITGVTVYVRMKGTELDDAVRPFLTAKPTGGFYLGTPKYTTTDYVNESHAFTPTGWTQDSINIMKVGIDPYGTPAGTITVSQVYAVVTYTPASTGYPAGVRANNAGAYPRASNTAVQVRGKQ